MFPGCRDVVKGFFCSVENNGTDFGMGNMQGLDNVFYRCPAGEWINNPVFVTEVSGQKLLQTFIKIQGQAVHVQRRRQQVR